MHTLAQLQAGDLAGPTRLDLAADLTEFPRELFTLADSLEILNLSGNQLAALPADLPRLHRLRVLFCSDNQFTELPAVLGQCATLEMVGFRANQIRTLPAAALPPHLRWLILTDNQLTELPPEIGNCLQLQKLMLAGNRLTALPATLARLEHLELLRLAANRLPALPGWLPTLPHLAWLAYAGNPFCATAEGAASARDAARPIGWPELHLEQQLGEGASGIISRAWWRPAGSTAPPLSVAIKVFKGAVTSDGRPESEMTACLSAGSHPNLIPVLGQLQNHPDGAQGLGLALIGPEFRNLAGPPSLETCTRDVYAPGTTFTLAAVLRLAHGVAAAAAHLHEKGIMHGDLYAHNILTTAVGEGLLGDFGAASFLDPANRETALALQRLEVRAFGILLEELLDQLAANARGTTTAAATIDVLRHLQRQCQEPVAWQRPLFTDLESLLAALPRPEFAEEAA